MKNFFEFIKKIQESDEETRKRWMIIFSVICGIIVLGFWIWFMKDLIFLPKSETEISNNPNFFNTIGNAIKSFITSIFSNISIGRTVQLK